MNELSNTSNFQSNKVQIASRTVNEKVNNLQCIFWCFETSLLAMFL